jgi:hypothetical protein
MVLKLFLRTVNDNLTFETRFDGKFWRGTTVKIELPKLLVPSSHADYGTILYEHRGVDNLKVIPVKMSSLIRIAQGTSRERI